MYKKTIMLNVVSALFILACLVVQIILGHGTILGIILASFTATCLGMVISNLIDIMYRMTREI